MAKKIPPINVPGNRPVIPRARLLSSLVTSANANRVASLGGGMTGHSTAHGQTFADGPNPRRRLDRNLVLVRNDSGENRAQGDVLGIDSPLIDPGQREREFRDRIMLLGVEPDEDLHKEAFVVLVEPITANGTGLAAISGAVITKVDVEDEDHDTAVVETGEYKFASASSGGLPILWKQDGTGELWAIVRIDSGGDSSIRWGKATANWTDETAPAVPYVTVNPCDDRLGTNPDTSETLTVYLPRTSERDPNVRSGEIIAFSATEDETYVCVSDYLDAKIGTLVMWVGTEANIPPGWRRYTSLDGRFPLGVDENHVDPIDATSDPWNLGDTGGTEKHTHDDHPDHAHTLGCVFQTGDDGTDQGDWLVMPDNVQSASWVTSGAVDPASVLTTRTLDHSDEKHVPPFLVVFFIERFE